MNWLRNTCGRSLLILVVGLQLAGCLTAPLAEQLTTPEPQAVPVELAPNFELPTLQGKRIALHQLRGRWVLINFWATWCIPCRDEMPLLQQLATEQQEHLTVLAINLRESPAEIQPFVDEFNLDLPILLQPDDAMLIAYNVRGLPLSLLVGPDGRLMRQQKGTLTPQTLADWLILVLAEFDHSQG